MYKKTTYKGTLNNVRGLWCGFKPEGLEVEEELVILYPEEGFVLKHKESGEYFSSVILKDENSGDNYIEEEEKEGDFRPE